MPLRSLIKYLLAALLVAQLSGQRSEAQYANTYYYMFGVPQANQLNPAFQPGCNGYLGVPFLAPVRFQVESNSITYGDVIQWNPGLDRNVTFMHPYGDKDKFLNALQPSNRIRSELATSIFSLGWRKDAWFFTIDLNERLVEGITFPKDLAELLIYGNLRQSEFKLSEMNQELKYFHQFAIGASYNMDDEIQVGVRAKLMLGGSNLVTENSLLNLKTSLDEWKFQSDIGVNVSIPYLEDIPVDQDGYLDMDSLANAGTDLLFNFPGKLADLWSPTGLSTLTGIKNPGFAIDLGFNYFPIEKLSFSASVVDLGFIRWRNYVWNFHQEANYSFTGLEFKLDDNFSAADALLDSLKEEMKIKVTRDPYTTMLAGKIYLGAAYNLTEKVRFGAVFRTRIYNYKFYNQYTISANVQPISMFSASLSYSIYGNSYTNLGLGLSLRLGPLNVFFITDQAPSAYLWPEDFTALNFRFGLNIVWGCTALPRAMKDRPLID